MKFTIVINEDKVNGLTKKQEDIINKISELIGVNILPYASTTKRSYINIDISKLEHNIVVNIERVGNQYNMFHVEPGGYKKIALLLK